MSSYKNRNQIRQRSGEPLDRKMDKWIQTGRQVVDGVAGNRPGQRRGRKDKETSVNLDKVGRWMGEKIDWFFEDDDDCLDDENMDDAPRLQESVNNTKRPLSAISLRVPKALPPQIEPRGINPNEVDEWPDEQSFRVNKWERKDNLIENSRSSLDESVSVERRHPQGRKNIPRSSRRKY